MKKEFEITNRLAELQARWLRENYDAQTIENALQSLNKRAFPLNVARALERAGGLKMPPSELLLANDPESQARSKQIREESLAKLRKLRESMRARS